MNGIVKPLFGAAAERKLTLSTSEKKFTDMTDQELIACCQASRQGAIDVLLKRHKSTLNAMVRKRFPELQDISDVVQEAQIRVWKSIGQLRNSDSFKGWLGQMVTNLCYDELRKKIRNNDVVSLDETYESDDGNKLEKFVVDSGNQPDKDFQQKELFIALEGALKKIPVAFRESVLLREVDGLSYEEIAVITNSELGTVKSRISRARTKIQKQMVNYLSEAA